MSRSTRSNAVGTAATPAPPDRDARLAQMRDRLDRAGQWHAGQTAGRRYPIGCVALEVTQRCNLDCSLCYLSENSEAVRDVPLEELLRRIDVIRAHYGPNTDIQVSGGEPTLRSHADLVAVVRHIARSGLRASLFTNGILASRDLLAELAAAGLTDVAFHVDMTQRRSGYADEAVLNSLRARYIEAARGLPLSVFFNTTVFDGNIAQIPALVRFFARHCDVVRLVSFQLQADTGRGVLGARGSEVSQASVIAAIRAGAGVALDFDALAAGHAGCNRYAMAWQIGGQFFDALADRAFVQRLMRETAGVAIPRTSRSAPVAAIARAVLRRPGLWWPALRYVARAVHAARGPLWSARGRVHKLSFFVHNFMDARALDDERLDACVFMAATQDGPVPMCAFNARRDDYLLRPLTLADGGTWQPQRANGDPAVIPLKLLKGRARQAALARRTQIRASSDIAATGT